MTATDNVIELVTYLLQLDIILLLSLFKHSGILTVMLQFQCLKYKFLRWLYAFLMNDDDSYNSWIESAIRLNTKLLYHRLRFHFLNFHSNTLCLFDRFFAIILPTFTLISLHICFLTSYLFKYFVVTNLKI